MDNRSQFVSNLQFCLYLLNREVYAYISLYAVDERASINLDRQTVAE